jgi:hypothetical protein
VKLEATLAEPTQFRADAERLSHILMEMQRCFLLHLCKELAPVTSPSPNIFFSPRSIRKRC